MSEKKQENKRLEEFTLELCTPCSSLPTPHKSCRKCLGVGMLAVPVRAPRPKAAGGDAP